MVKIRNTLIFASVALVGAQTASKNEVTNRDQPCVNHRQDLLNTINNARKAKGLKDLCINTRLMNAAQDQANHMVEIDTITSTGLENSTPEIRARGKNFTAEKVTELVGGGFATAFEVVAQWVNSKSAKETLFSNYTAMGPGYVFDKKTRYMHYWVVDFSDGKCGDGDPTTSEESAATGESSENDSGTKDPLTFDDLKTPEDGKTPSDAAKNPSDAASFNGKVKTSTQPGETSGSTNTPSGTSMTFANLENPPTESGKTQATPATPAAPAPGPAQAPIAGTPQTAPPPGSAPLAGKSPTPATPPAPPAPATPPAPPAPNGAPATPATPAATPPVYPPTPPVYPPTPPVSPPTPPVSPPTPPASPSASNSV